MIQKSDFHRFYILAILLLITLSTFGSSKIRIQGKVIELATGKTIKDVAIASQGTLLGITDTDGHFVIQAVPDAELLFNHPDYDDIKIAVNNRQILNVQLTERKIELEEVIIIGKVQNKKIGAEPTDLEVKGNYFHLKTKFRIPSQIFKSDTRFIVQPTLYNVTQKTYKYFRPVVIDGDIFKYNNLRFNEFHISRDSLQPYAVPNQLKEQGNIYAYFDSIYIEPKDMDQDFRAECYLAVNRFQERPTDYLDTVTIARGTKNPLRFMAYGFTPVEITDTTLIPKPEMALNSEKGISRIGFEINRATIDPNDSLNREELRLIKQKIGLILANESATLRSISVTGYTSPDGPYERNIDLARKRTQVILNKITESVDPGQLKFIRLESDAHVESWQQVARLMHQDSLPFAYKADSIIKIHKGVSGPTHWGFKKLKEYKEQIAPVYLPRLRRTEYTLEYSIFRKLKDEEILEKYQQGERDFSRYEFYRICALANKGHNQMQCYQQAMEQYPDFLYIANQMAVSLIHNKQYQLDLLKPSLDRYDHWEPRYNQAIMALGLKEFALADSLSSLLPDRDENTYLKAVVATLNSRYNEAYPVIASKGGLNEVLLLLCMNRNREAELRMTSLLELSSNADNAQMWYIRAVCANRNENLTLAMESLRRAFSLDPSLKDLARSDSDVMDIVDLVEY